MHPITREDVDRCRRLALSRWRVADRAQVESDAMLGLVNAARTFDPARGKSWKSWSADRVLWDVADQARVRAGRDGAREPALVELIPNKHVVTWNDDRSSFEEASVEALAAAQTVWWIVYPALTTAEAKVLLAELAGETGVETARRWGTTDTRVSQVRRQMRNRARQAIAWDTRVRERVAA